ncbi:hypothetical protein RradSPS_1860 [Rubrobacter radiotolerans]|uniref:GrpB family protein n=1 Tax=Rubrobacter radiotolerans TaxID=42256 RepID=A0A023X486_RUBRA|nr:GrpB family protein [Rubrobacter radiotolerans]AHY47143.1 hypothetical protein RradSPS_1860 [Rubrobacter radiotolerans]MDX5894549.1 GrpB family protein [Rubrobacter radiotolerans]SMC06232.1 GrpB domain, predicted nucleotidyltransferase, UPF0157 family [Rubrobacter radiotolerans DSM 5868]
MTEESVEFFGAPLGEPVRLIPYDASWPQEFEQHRKRLADALGAVALRIEHIGSTSVPGLPAKPVIDILVSVPDLKDEDAYRPSLEDLGLPLCVRTPERRFFRVRDGGRDVHVHVVVRGGEEERRHLLFPAYLRAFPERRKAYARLKEELAEEFRIDRTRYTEKKAPFIEETVRLAEAAGLEVG